MTDTLQERLRKCADIMDEMSISLAEKPCIDAIFVRQAADALDARDREIEQLEIRIRSLQEQNKMKY